MGQGWTCFWFDELRHCKLCRRRFSRCSVLQSPVHPLSSRSPWLPSEARVILAPPQVSFPFEVTKKTTASRSALLALSTWSWYHNALWGSYITVICWTNNARSSILCLYCMVAMLLKICVREKLPLSMCPWIYQWLHSGKSRCKCERFEQ